MKLLWMWRHRHENWVRDFTVGRWTLELEWVPKANGYAVVSLTRNSKPD